MTQRVEQDDPDIAQIRERCKRYQENCDDPQSDIVWSEFDACTLLRAYDKLRAERDRWSERASRMAYERDAALAPNPSTGGDERVTTQNPESVK